MCESPSCRIARENRHSWQCSTESSEGRPGSETCPEGRQYVARHTLAEHDTERVARFETEIFDSGKFDQERAKVGMNRLVVPANREFTDVLKDGDVIWILCPP